jgi:hypothetical protein
MKRYAFFVIFALVACTSGSKTVSLPNIFGLDELDVTLKCTSPCSNLNEITFAGSFTGLPLNDLDPNSSKIPEIYQNIAPLKVLESLGFETVMTATSKVGKPNDFPNTFEVKTSKLELSIVNGSGSPSLNKNFTSSGTLTTVYTRRPEPCQETLEKTTCTYETDVSEPLLNLELSGADIATFYNKILTDGASPNPVSGSFNITFAGDKFPPSDTEVSYTLESSRGQLEF